MIAYQFPSLAVLAEHLKERAANLRLRAKAMKPTSREAMRLQAEAYGLETAASVVGASTISPEPESRPISAQEVFAKRAAEIKAGLGEG